MTYFDLHHGTALVSCVCDELSGLPRYERVEELVESAYSRCVTHIVENTYCQWVEWTRN